MISKDPAFGEQMHKLTMLIMSSMGYIKLVEQYQPATSSYFISHYIALMEETDK